MAEPHLNPTSSYRFNSVPTFEQWSAMQDQLGIIDDDDFEFPEDPKELFKMVGIPMPRMLTLLEARKEAKELAKDIFTEFETLHAILERHEDSIRKKWMKKTKEQRKKIFLEIMPDIPADHRPDILAVEKETKAQREKGSKYLTAFECPYINLEDLCRPRNLLLFLNTRGNNTPDIFAASDFAATGLGRASSAVTTAYLNGHTMVLSGQNTAEKYGRIIPWEEDPDAFDLMVIRGGMLPGVGLRTMEIQRKVYRFLISCCEKILQNTANDLTTKHFPMKSHPDLIPPYLDPNAGGYESLKAMREEAPYRLPEQLDFERLKGLLSAKRQEAEDHIFALREDPGYFAQTVLEYREHQQLFILDPNGKLPAMISTPRFMDIVTRKILTDAYMSLAMWNIAYEDFTKLIRLKRKYAGQISQTERLPKEYETAFAEFKYLLDKMVLLPIHQIKIGLAASPPMRKFFVRKPDPGSNNFTIVGKESIFKDKLLWALLLFGDEMQMRLLGLEVIVEQIERIISTREDQRQRLSIFIADVFSEIAFIVELQRQIKSYQPWSGMFEVAAIWDEKEVEANYNAKSVKIENIVGVIWELNLGKLGDPSGGRFEYPSERKPTESTVNAMRLAEQKLDIFWKCFDAEILTRVGHTPELMFPYNRPLQRAPPWVPPPPPSTATKSTPSKIKLPTAADTTFTTFKTLSIDSPSSQTTPPYPKVKTKTRGEPSPTPAATSGIITFDTSILPHTPDVQPTIPVDRRAYKVLTTLFHTPSNHDNHHPGEIPWIDFLHAMVQTGFKPVKLYGSVWQFTPMTLDVERSIQFHEPHPGKKIAYTVCRRIGRRLNRAYGWVGGMFCLVK